MREIKFRALQTNGKGWVEGDLINGVGLDGTKFNQIENNDANEYRQWQVIPETVGQFTGLKDRNGVEIYEGDILQYKSGMQQQEGFYLKKEVVRFRNGSFYAGCNLSDFNNINSNIDERLWHWSGSFNTKDFYGREWDVEVIGNIHENPEPTEVHNG